MAINGAEYAWQDIEVVMAGKNLVGITAISYTSRKAHENVYGRGAKPVATVRGKEEFEGSITILQSELEALQSSLGSRNKGVTAIDPFNITVAYSAELGDTVTDSLLSCRITEVTKAFSNEDMNMVVELPLVIGDIEYNS